VVKGDNRVRSHVLVVLVLREKEGGVAADFPFKLLLQDREKKRGKLRIRGCGSLQVVPLVSLNKIRFQEEGVSAEKRGVHEGAATGADLGRL
jgi:hypothetical protein